MTPSEIRLLALSLYASARKVERLPRYAEHNPGEIVEIVKVPAHLCNPHLYAVIMATPVYEEI